MHRLVGKRHRGAAAVGQLPGQHLVEHDPGGVDVAAGVGRAVADLLGCEVADGPHHDTLCHGVGRLVDGPGEPEVRDLHLAVVAQQDVLRLDVTVYKAGVVSGREGFEDRLDDLDSLGRSEPTAVADVLAQGLPPDKLHHQIDDMPVGPVVTALVEDGDCTRGVQPRRGVRLPVEASDEVLIVREGGMHDLESDQPVQPIVVRDIDRRHAADGDAFLCGVTPVQ